MAIVDIRMPNITGVSDKEKIEQLKNHIVYLTKQLQYILTNLDESNFTEEVTNKVNGSHT